ncbi:hypothetical protein [Mucilaginibacter agri]|uniref:Uncharacterized protein n=1 Tax=Mucilaginibacter agri TaxID=2695265 RepID=A0A965ZIZ0_9SPHI|nr:hypothetical protein [Mucilaginibacter agri]NCD70829.1 hypothetical protein [Mucilaginibacter agri]
MKTNLILLMATATTLFSCKKDNKLDVTPTTTVSTGPKYPVSFSASAFASQTSAFGAQKTVTSVKQTTALKDDINYLTYVVVAAGDSLANIIKKVTQKSTDANFGTIRDTLPNGNYTVYFMGATRKSMTLESIGNSSFPDPEDPPSLIHHIFVSDGGNIFRGDTIGDIFVKVLNIKVESRTNTDVVMERLVSKIQVVIQDAIPANVVRLECRWDGFVGAYDPLRNVTHPGFGSGFPTMVYNHTIVPADIGKKGFTFSTTDFPGGGHYIILNGYTATDDYLPTYSRLVLDNFPAFKSNTMITFSGTRFDNSSSTNVTVNPTWGPGTTLPFTDY